MDAEAEATLLSRLHYGDQQALRELYEQLSGNVLALAIQLLHSHEEAEEVLQDTFLKVFQNPRNFDPDCGSARAFIDKVARNDCLSRLRAKRSRPKKDAEWNLYDSKRQPAAAESNPVLNVQTEQALAQLEPLDRDLLRASFYGGYSHGELAERFELPLGTIKSRLRRALLTLRGNWGAS